MEKQTKYIKCNSFSEIDSIQISSYYDLFIVHFTDTDYWEPDNKLYAMGEYKKNCKWKVRNKKQTGLNSEEFMKLECLRLRNENIISELAMTFRKIEKKFGYWFFIYPSNKKSQIWNYLFNHLGVVGSLKEFSIKSTKQKFRVLTNLKYKWKINKKEWNSYEEFVMSMEQNSFRRIGLTLGE